MEIYVKNVKIWILRHNLAVKPTYASACNVEAVEIAATVKLARLRKNKPAGGDHAVRENHGNLYNWKTRRR
jgi:hypothetical protein